MDNWNIATAGHDVGKAEYGFNTTEVIHIS